MFYTYRQNNSGGSFIVNKIVGEYVIVEADNSVEANSIAEEHEIYFDGCDHGLDCSCCGDRWNGCYNDDGSDVPKIYHKTIEEFTIDPGFACVGNETTIHIYYKNGDHKTLVIDVAGAIKKKKAEERSVARKLWGNFFTLSYGIRNKQPIRFYETAGYKETYFYDRSGNLSIEEGFNVSGYEVISYASENKSEVEEFMAGAQEILDIAKSAVLSVETDDSFRGKGMAAAVKLFMMDKK